MADSVTFSEITELCRRLTEIPGVSGGEELFSDEIIKAVFEYTSFFDKCDSLSGGGLLFTHYCGKKNAPKLLYDAHLDTVGFVVTELLTDGFLRVRPMGGVDKRLVFASEIEIYGREKVSGVFVSTPPHLAKKDGDKLPDISEIFVDTGLSDEKLSQLVKVGDICTFAYSMRTLLGDTISCRSMDDRICACAILAAAKMLEKNPPECDVLFSFSSAEEVNGTGGEALGKLMCDGAVVLDVNFGRDKGVHEKESYVLGDGCGVSYSCTTSRQMTDALVSCAKKNDITLHTLVETKHTGTNAHYLSNAHMGTPCAVLSIPEKYMHSPFEAVNLSDVLSCAQLLCAFAYDFPDLDRKMKENRKIIGERMGDS